MTERHHRPFYYITNRNEMRGDVERSATPSETAASFRFSEMVPRGVPLPPTEELLQALADRMVNADAKDGDIPAGFTYLGQFVDHDLTRDRSGLSLNATGNAQTLIQARSPAVDLDSVYGAGPQDPLSKPFYEADGVRLKLGSTQAVQGPNPLANKTLDVNQPLDSFDLPRIGTATTDTKERRRAQIGDPRNDENLIVAQIHLAFLRFHNAVVAGLAGGSTSSMLFERAREEVVRHYQWMLRHDFLPRIVDPAIVDDVFTNGRKVFEVDGQGFPTMPIEFSVAAYRLGHSMIRDNYDWNPFFNDRDGIAPGTLENMFRFSGTSGNLSPFNSAGNGASDIDNPIDGTFERLPTNWIADWTRLFDMEKDTGLAELAPADGASVNMAFALDTSLTNPLKNLPLGSFDPARQAVAVMERNLAFRNLRRGRVVRLATAQEVALHFKKLGAATPILTSEQIIGKGMPVDLSDLSDTLKQELVTETPLWFYVLREAEILGGKLGAIGGRIVAETFHRAIEGSLISYLRTPSWKPTLGRKPGQFLMADLLLRAFDATKGELRILSPNAPRPAQVF